MCLRYIEEFSLRFLEKVINIVALVESLRLDFRGEGNQAPRQKFLCHDLGVVFHIGSRQHACGQFGDVDRTACFLQVAVAPQLLLHRHHVDGPLVKTQSRYRLVDHGVHRVVERVGRQYVGHVHVCVLLKHQRSEHHLFHLRVAGREFACGVLHYGLELRLAVLSVFCH